MTGKTNIQELLKVALDGEALTIEELVAEAGTLLERVAPQQTRYKVNERPDVRTIRYYINQKLLPRAVGYQGGKARFTGSHLLRLLTIKKLQTEHQTLRQIRRVLDQHTDAELQQLLIGEPTTPLIVQPKPILETTPDYHTIRRVALSGGANLDLPGRLDPTQRQKLAEELEALARELRSKTDETEGE